MKSYEIEQQSRFREPRQQLLNRCYEQVRLVILARQDPITGLLPASTVVTAHGDYTHAWVRDNVYSILAPWGLALAYRHYERDAGKRCLLEQSVVKLMRGLLMAMMRQAGKVENFNQPQNPLQALNARYDCLTGNSVGGDNQWRHLQLDATALFLLMLAQMTASGLRIVVTLDEVDFIQNLVHYLGRAYHTPDFGIWQRGHRLNQDVPEINASSIGMVKAALEVLQGFDLFGAHGGPASVIHVVPDDIAHIRVTLETLLPRESNSKETDAALLAVIGFPAFAVENPKLVERTRHEIIGKLQGRYGCKRFPRDGYQTALENKTRLHYEIRESDRFEHIESEWPLFFTYLLLDRTLRGDTEQGWQYRERLESLLVERQGQRLLPELYYIPEERLELEKAKPQSQERLPSQTVPLVWAQSLYLLGVLLQEGFIQAHELDPLGRHSRIGRYRDNCIQIALIAESKTVQQRLEEQGIAAQTPQQVAPIGIYPASALEGILSRLGHNRTLGLSGRPPGWLGSLATSRVFILAGGKTAVFTPSFLEPGGFYLGLDNYLLVERIKAELIYLDRHWEQPGQPLVILSIGAAMLEAADHDTLLALLRSLQANGYQGVQIRTARLAELLPTAGWKRMDGYDFPIQARGVDYPGDSGIPLNRRLLDARPLTTAEALAWRWEPDDRRLLQRLTVSRNPHEQIELLVLLWERLGPDFIVEERGYSLRQWLEALYIQAGQARLWGVMRRAAGRLELVDVALQDAVADIVMRRHPISMGRAYSHQAIITHPMSNAEIIDRIRAYGGDDFRGQVLIQEIVLFLGMLINADPGLCKGTVTLRPWRLLLSMIAALSREQGITPWEALDGLLECSPHALLTRLLRVIRHPGETRQCLAELEALSYRGELRDPRRLHFSTENELTLVGQDVWSTWREINGVPSRAPQDIHLRVWEILRHCGGLVIGDRLDIRNRLDSHLVRQVDLAQVAKDLALRVEQLLNNIQAPEYRQLSIEALLILADVFRANPNLYIESDLVVDVLIGAAVYHSWRERQGSVTEEDYNEYGADAWNAFYACSPYRVANAVMVALSSLLGSTDQKVKMETVA